MFERANLWNYESYLKNSFAIDSPILEEGFRLYNMTLWFLDAEKKEGKQKIEESLLFFKTGWNMFSGADSALSLYW